MTRPFVYGLAIGGKHGARDVIKGLLAVSILHSHSLAIKIFVTDVHST